MDPCDRLGRLDVPGTPMVDVSLIDVPFAQPGTERK